MADSLEKIADDIFRAAYFTAGTDEDVFYEAGPRLEDLGLSFEDLNNALKPVKKKYKGSRPGAADDIFEIINEEFSGDEMRRAYKSFGIDPGAELKKKQQEKAEKAAAEAEAAAAAEAEAEATAEPEVKSEPVSLEEPMMGPVNEEVFRPNPQQVEQFEEPNLSAPGMNELRTARSIGAFEGKRNHNQTIEENIQKGLLDSARRQMRREDRAQKANEAIDDTRAFRERDLRRTFNRSPHGAFKYGKSFDELDQPTQDMLREKYLNFRLNRAGTSQAAPQEAPTTRQRISQEDFDNMSDADVQRELSGVIGGGYESPRPSLENLTVPGGGKKIEDMPYRAPQENNFEPQRAPINYNRAEDLKKVEQQASAETPAMPKPEFITRENNAPAPAPAPAPAAAPQAPKEKMVPIYGANGIVGYRPYSEQKAAAEAYAKNRMKNSPRSLLGDVNSAGMDKLYPTLDIGNIRGQINKSNIEKHRKDNPFGEEYRPAAKRYNPFV